MTRRIRITKRNSTIWITRILKFLKNLSKRQEQEYSKRLLNRIVNSSILRMFGTYILAWCGKTEVAETLSKTIAASIISVVVGYLAKSVIENISKHTDTFGRNRDLTDTTDTIDSAPTDVTINMNRDC